MTRKRLLISRLRMAVVTMCENVRRDAVILPGDKRYWHFMTIYIITFKMTRFDDETVVPTPLKSIDEMMEVSKDIFNYINYMHLLIQKVIKNHIEDLVMVNSRVQGSEQPQGYIRALASEKSHLRIDY